jgi:hypothetical protein
MENCKIDEIQLELECDKLRDEGGAAFERAADLLIAIQRRNNENLQNMFKGVYLYLYIYIYLSLSIYMISY